MKRTHIIIICLIIFSGLKALAQEYVNKDSLISDFNYLIQQLEATHPDPYSGFGGKVFFHKQAFDLKNELARKDHTLVDFSSKVSAFLANLQDGHTSLFTPENTKNKNKTGIFIVSGKVIPAGIILSEVPLENKEYLGSRILGINGLAIDSLLQIIKTKKACENLYGQYFWLNMFLSHSDFILEMFPDLKNTMTLNIETPDGERKDLTIPLIGKDKRKEYPTAQLPHWEIIPEDAYLSYKYLDKKKEVMFFKLTSIMARENYEVTLKNNWPGAYDDMKWFYKNTLKKEMPADTAKALAGIPSYSETFFHMLKEMKKHNSKTLIIDLRSNGGGWTPITLPSLYQLYGDRYLQTDMDTHFYRLLSPLYLSKINKTREEFNKMYGHQYQLGEYIFNEENPGTSCIEVQRENFIRNCLSDLKPELEKQKGKPVYTPEKIYVITNEQTFSAAFHYAFYLWKMGAVVVGVPSMQAPNTFMEQTSFNLPHTHLEGSISNSIQVFLPGKDRRAKTFWPDLMPEYNDYKRYLFDLHSEVRYLLDQINK